MITREIRVWLAARERMSGYAAYVQAAIDWHAASFQQFRERGCATQTVEERDKVPEYQTYLKVKDAFDAAAKLLPEYAAVEAQKRRRAQAVKDARQLRKLPQALST
jgi:hypothetical protein